MKRQERQQRERMRSATNPPASRVIRPYLDQSALRIASRRGLDSGIYQSLAPSHGVEKELGRRQPAVERVAHEPLRLRSFSCKNGFMFASLWCRSNIVGNRLRHPVYAVTRDTTDSRASNDNWNCCQSVRCKGQHVQWRGKWGRERLSKPSGIRAPLTTWLPTHTSIWEMLVSEPRGQAKRCAIEKCTTEVHDARQYQDRCGTMYIALRWFSQTFRIG